MEYKVRDKRVTTQDIVNHVFCCEGRSFDYWAEICCNVEDYEAARLRLMGPDRPKADRCYEDVLVNILEQNCADGSTGKLTIYDREKDEDHTLTLEKLLAGWGKYVAKTGKDDFTKYDTADADSILQYALFGDRIY